MANGSVFQQALQRSTPVFDSLLNTIQQETQRIERNRELARQQELQEDLTELKAQKEIEVFQETQAVENQKDRALQVKLAQMNNLFKNIQEQTALQQEQTKTILEQKRNITQDLKEEFNQKYGTVIEQGLTGLPTPDVSVFGDSLESLQGQYEITTNGTTELLSQTEFDERYGWMRGAVNDLIEPFRELQFDDRILSKTRTEEVALEDLTTSDGQPVSADVLGLPEDPQQTVSKKILGGKDAVEFIQKVKNGDRQAYEKWQNGLVELNTQTSSQSEDRDIIQERMASLLSELGKEHDRSWIPWSTSFFGESAPIIDFPVSEIGNKLSEIGVSNADGFIQDIVGKYSTLTEGTVNTDNLFFNPKLLTDGPSNLSAEEYFITRDEKARTLNEDIQQAAQSDFELTEENMINQQSKNFYQQAIQD